MNKFLRIAIFAFVSIISPCLPCHPFLKVFYLKIRHFFIKITAIVLQAFLRVNFKRISFNKAKTGLTQISPLNLCGPPYHMLMLSIDNLWLWKLINAEH